MRKVNLISWALVAISLLAAPLALGQGGNPPASTEESGVTSGHGMTAVEQTTQRAELVPSSLALGRSLPRRLIRAPKLATRPQSARLDHARSRRTLHAADRTARPRQVRSQSAERWNAGGEQGGTRGLARFFMGTYSVSDADHVLTLHVEASTFPSWIGADQKRAFRLTADEMKWTNRTPAISAEVVEVAWRRAP